MSEREDLEQAIATVEAQRASLGDAAVDAVLVGLRQKLAELESAESQVLQETVARTSGAERRIVTVLFCDVTGSTALAEKLDPETWAEIMDEAFGYLTEPIDRFDGTVARLMGDAILAFFGAPKAHEDDPQRAVRASLAIIENMRSFREELRRERGLDFNVRVGINTGLVVTGRIGSKLHEEYTALGDAVNVAARMEQTAVPGTIQIAQSTYRLVASQFDFLPLGGIAVKGRSEPVQAYRVLGRVAQPEPARGLTQQGIHSSLVGRETEYAEARKSVARLIKGKGGILAIVGEAGVGKSRLLAEVHQDSSQEALLWLEGRTLSYGQTISYWPFQEILWAYAGINEDDGETEAWQKLEGAVHQLFDEETIKILPFLASLISLEVKGEFSQRVEHLDGEAIGHQIYLAARRFFERLSMKLPTVLVFEDLHWADESSSLLLEHLLPLVERYPLLFLISSRPYRQSPLSSFRRASTRNHAARYNELLLSPLSQADSAQLAHNLLDIDDLPPDVQAMIVNKASGNPFFLEEIIRALISTGAIVYNSDSGRWQATTKVESISIPDTVQGVIMARVDRLDKDVRRVLQMAAVVGRSFFYRVLEAMGHVDRALDQHLAELEQVQLIRKKQSVPELEYIFKHALAQEATYQSILLRKRRELHARVGQAIESLFEERLEEFYGVLAYHYASAENWKKAQEYLFKAGDKAGQVAADAEALAHYRQALEAYERVFGDRWDPVQRAVLARKMGEAHFRRGEHEQALDHFQQAFKLLGRPPIPATRGATLLAIANELRRQIGHRLLPRFFVKLGSEEVSLAVEEEARIHYLLGWIFLFTERERLLWAAVRRLNFAEQSGYLPGAASGSAAFGVVLDMVPLLKLAEAYHRRAVSLADQSGDLNALGVAHQALGFFELNLGNFALSTARVQRSEEVFRQAGDLHGLGSALILLAFNRIHQGHLRESLEYIDELITNGQDGADPQLVSWGYIARGAVQLQLGRLDQAVTDLQQGILIADMLPDYYWKILAQGFLGQCHVRQGMLAEAFESLDIGEQVHVKRGIAGPALYYLRIGQLEAHLAVAGQSDEVEKRAQLTMAGKARKTVQKLSNAYRLFQAEAQRLIGTYQWLQGKPEDARLSWQRSLAVADELGQHYELGVTHLEMGRRLKDLSHLRQAEAALSEIGAAWHLAQLRIALTVSDK
jgi:class 3 adenylate cyclase/tetratricopeptide (TPR) repeat protein